MNNNQTSISEGERLGSDTRAQDNDNAQDDIRVLSASSCSALDMAHRSARVILNDWKTTHLYIQLNTNKLYFQSVIDDTVTTYGCDLNDSANTKKRFLVRELLSDIGYMTFQTA